MPAPAEIWYASVVGGDGKPKARPVLVISNPIAGTSNVLLLTVSSRTANARPDDITITSPAELAQAGLVTESFISTSFVVTLDARALSTKTGTLTKERYAQVREKFIAHIG